CENLFVGIELIKIFLELAAARDLGHTERRTLSGDFVLASLGEVFIAETFVGKFGDGLHFGFGPGDQNHSGELAAILFEVLFLFNDDANAFACNDAVGAGGPGLGVDDERDDVGSRHAGVDVLIGPSASERSPGFEVGIAHAGGG